MQEAALKKRYPSIIGNDTVNCFLKLNLNVLHPENQQKRRKARQQDQQQEIFWNA